MRRQTAVTIITVLTIVLIANGAGAATINVGPSETYKTIQAAIDVANDGDTIYVAAGTYSGETTLSADESIDIIGTADASFTPFVPVAGVVNDDLAVTVGGDASGFIIDIANGAYTVRIENLKITGTGSDNGVYIAGPNQSTVEIVNCDFLAAVGTDVRVVAGDDCAVTIQYCNFGAGAGAGSNGVENNDTNITVIASDNWWNSYKGPNQDEVYDAGTRYAATTSGSGTVNTSPYTLGQYRLNTDLTGEFNNLDIDDDDDDAPDKGEAAKGTDPIDDTKVPVPLLSATVYVNADWAATILGADPDGLGPALLFGYDSFDNIQDAIYGVQDN